MHEKYWIFGFILFLLLGRIGYLILFFKLLKQKKKLKSYSDFFPSVSVVIAARNEADNLERFLPKVLEQDYPQYEVIVVNHASIDNTDIVLKRFKQKYKHLVVRTLRNDSISGFGKKLPLTLGIKAAKYDYLLLTDADCFPGSNRWIKTMIAPLKHKDFVLGYGGFEKEKSFINHLVRYDTVQSALLYLSIALVSKPYMAVGRNLAYRKSIFFEAKGFASHSYIISGDDDLFVNQMATKNNTAIQILPESFTYSQSASSFKSWYRSKIRHLKTSNHYSFFQKLNLFLEAFFRFALLPSVILCSVLYFHYYLIIVLLVDVLLRIILLKKYYKLFYEEKLLVYSIFFDIIAPLLIAGLLLVNQFKKQSPQWKRK
jgi:cellulose synthase/poly-beta-1,6-N-acetylglucosamine synthase-like glycosyltransferase